MYELLAVYFLTICFFFSITLYISFGEKQTSKHPWKNRAITRSLSDLHDYFPDYHAKGFGEQSMAKSYNNLKRYTEVYAIDGKLLQWLDYHLDKYPDGKLPNQESKFIFHADKIKVTTTLFDSQHKDGVALLKEVKRALNDKTTHKVDYPSYRSLGSIAGVNRAIAFINKYGGL